MQASKHSEQSQRTIPPPRRQNPGRWTEITTEEDLDLYKYFKVSPKSLPATVTATVHFGRALRSIKPSASLHLLAQRWARQYILLALGHSCSAQNEPSSCSITSGPTKRPPGMILDLAPGMRSRTIHHYLELLLCSSQQLDTRWHPHQDRRGGGRCRGKRFYLTY